MTVYVECKFVDRHGHKLSHLVWNVQSLYFGDLLASHCPSLLVGHVMNQLSNRDIGGIKLYLSFCGITPVACKHPMYDCLTIAYTKHYFG